MMNGGMIHQPRQGKIVLPSHYRNVVSPEDDLIT
jgi:hypothetical protein